MFYEKGLQPAVDEAVHNDGPEHVVDAADAVKLRTPRRATRTATSTRTSGSTRRCSAEAADAFTDEMSEADPDHAG